MIVSHARQPTAISSQWLEYVEEVKIALDEGDLDFAETCARHLCATTHCAPQARLLLRETALKRALPLWKFTPLLAKMIQRLCPWHPELALWVAHRIWLRQPHSYELWAALLVAAEKSGDTATAYHCGLHLKIAGAFPFLIELAWCRTLLKNGLLAEAAASAELACEQQPEHPEARELLRRSSLQLACRNTGFQLPVST